MQLLIHGGYFKTGTTAFQQWLHASRGRLAAMGIFVPDPGPRENHGYPLNASIRGDCEDQSIWTALANAADAGHRFAVVSAETIASYHPQDFQALYERASAYDPILFLVLRHWSGYLPSKHAQEIRRGDWLSLPDYLVRMEQLHDRHPDSDFGLPFARAAAAGFENLIAVGYRRNVALDVIADLTDTDVAALDGGQWPEARVNARPDPLRLDRIRLANAIMGAREGLEIGHTVEEAMDDGREPAFLLLSDVIAMLETQDPALTAELDRAIMADRVEIDMADWQPTFSQWRDDLKALLLRLSAEDRLGAFSGADTPPIVAASCVDAQQLEPGFVERLHEKLVAIRAEVWRKRRARRRAHADREASPS